MDNHSNIPQLETQTFFKNFCVHYYAFLSFFELYNTAGSTKKIDSSKYKYKWHWPLHQHPRLSAYAKAASHSYNHSQSASPISSPLPRGSRFLSAGPPICTLSAASWTSSVGGTPRPPTTRVASGTPNEQEDKEICEGGYEWI